MARVLAQERFRPGTDVVTIGYKGCAMIVYTLCGITDTSNRAFPEENRSCCANQKADACEGPVHTKPLTLALLKSYITVRIVIKCVVFIAL